MVGCRVGSAADSFSSVTSGWRSGVQVRRLRPMVAAAAPYSGFCVEPARGPAGAAASAKAVASVFETAQAAMVHPLVVAANRSQLVQWWCRTCSGRTRRRLRC